MTDDATERLFWADPKLSAFSARVLEVRPADRGFSVVLDRTAFFPESGGQPADQGRMGQALIVDAKEEGDRIVHLVEGPAPGIGQEVACVVDMDRRRELGRQHTAQHVLSFLALAKRKWRTVGFHLGEEVSTVDFEAGEVSRADLLALELEANRVVLENRAVTTEIASRDEAGTFRSRNLDGSLESLRIVDIEGLDRSACCGMHVGRTGEIGLVLLGRTEKVRHATRIEFRAGLRALEESDRLFDIVDGLSRRTSAGAAELPAWVESAQNEIRELRREAARLIEEASRREAHDLLGDAKEVRGTRIVAAVLRDRDPQALRVIASELRKEKGVAALLGAEHDGKAFLAFARSDGIGLDMALLLKDAASEIRAKGGGRPDLAQAGGGDPSRLEAAIATAARKAGEILT